jgi:O-antigen/teichoic acid export membrane protein
VSKLKIGVNNLVYGIISQVIIFSFGLILPRMFIMDYGSEINGIFVFLIQIFGYFALLEAGIGLATVQALFLPLSSNNKEDVSSVLAAANIFYKKISIKYLICVLLFALIYAFIAKINLDKTTIFLIIVLQGMAGVINFYFQATFKQLIVAEGKNYVISNITLIITILTSLAKILLIYYGADIVYIQVAFFAFSLAQLVLYKIYFVKNFGWVNLVAKPNFDALKEKSAILYHQISGLIFSGTNVIVLSIFCDLTVVSIYSIYNLIIMGLNMLASNINSSFQFVLGHKYHQDRNDYLKFHDAYNVVYITFIFALMSICLLLYIPFIKLYTAGADENYVILHLPLLFCVIENLSAIRMVSSNLILISGHMKKTVVRTSIEAFLNLSFSLLLVNIYGIYGVLWGTIIALLYRSNDIIFYADKVILNRSVFKSYIPIILNTLIFFAIVVFNIYVPYEVLDYLDFVKFGVIFTISLIPFYFIVNYFFFQKEFNYIFEIVKNKFGKLS